MSGSPPPFSALRAVEAAARHRSYTWAAKELQVTHSAVSQSIKRLEADLGTVLFERAGNGMEPSQAALRLAQTYSDAADSLGKTLTDITRNAATGALTVQMPTDFGRLWFSRRMSRLTEALPDLRIEPRLDGPEGGSRDMEVAYSSTLAGRGTKSLAPIVATPLCSPRFAALNDLSSPAAITHRPLLGGGLAWERWTSHFNLPANSVSRVSSFDDAGMALESAAQGAGVVLSHLFAAEAYLEDGRLVPLPFQAATDLQLQVRNSALGGKADFGKRFEMWLSLEISRSLALESSRQAAAAAR
jgi:DNA-binding transcriptional LysR family regulator